MIQNYSFFCLFIVVLKQRREADAALFSELHRKLQTQVSIHNVLRIFPYMMHRLDIHGLHIVLCTCWFCCLVNRAYWNIDGPSYTSCSASVKTQGSRPTGFLYEIFLQLLHNNIMKIIWHLCIMFFPVHRCVVMELFSPRLCPVTSTPPRSTTPVPRASRSATQSALPPPITPAWPPVASAVWECSPSTGLDRPLRLCLPGEWQWWLCNLRVKCRNTVTMSCQAPKRTKISI